MADRVVSWDFDGTLAQRPGLWSACVLEVLDEAEPGHGISLDQLRAGLLDGFPWHRADVPHPELSEPDEWWRVVGSVIEASLVGAGVAAERAQAAVPLVRQRSSDAAHGWEVFADTAEALAAAAAAGWRNVVLSNHVPELPALVAALGLGEHLDGVLTSALAGFEKPHPEAYRQALRQYGNPWGGVHGGG